eukprot:13551438-Heterocapsa_arctica.AAC.1
MPVFAHAVKGDRGPCKCRKTVTSSPSGQSPSHRGCGNSRDTSYGTRGDKSAMPLLQLYGIFFLPAVQAV